MIGWPSERKASRLLKGNLDIDDVLDELATLRDEVRALAASAGRSAGRDYARARDFALEAVDEAEEVMKDHLAASLILAIGLGIAVYDVCSPPRRC